MSKYIPIVFSLILVLAMGVLVVVEKNIKIDNVNKFETLDLQILSKQHSCRSLPKFLKKSNIPQPVLIDLSQKQYKGVAMHYGPNYTKTLHPSQWQQYGNFSTYSLDEKGNAYLVPTPFISIQSNTFELQKSLYKLDTNSGHLAPFMYFDDVKPTSNNPYGLTAIVYDCDDQTLWLAAIDESDYGNQNGIIYHVNPQSKKILQKITGIDVLSMALVQGKHEKYLLLGSARNNGLYAYSISNGILSNTGDKLLELPSANEHIRKIKIKGKNKLELQSIPFGYSLIAQTEDKYRTIYKAIWFSRTKSWKVEKIN